MSHYTNDIDALRQMIGQSLPNITLTIVTCISVICVMLYYSVWMCIIIVAGVLFMSYVTKQLGGRSARNFVAQQREIGIVDGPCGRDHERPARREGLLPRGCGAR